MIAEYAKKSNRWAVWILVAIVGRILSGMLLGDSQVNTVLTIGLLLLGLISLIMAIAYHARSKGYSPWLGLLAFLGLIGIIIAVVLPDKTKAQPPAA